MKLGSWPKRPVTVIGVPPAVRPGSLGALARQGREISDQVPVRI